jgi:thioredoxin 1
MKLFSRIVLVMSLLAIVLHSCGQQAEVKHLSALEFQKLITDSSGILLDVRTIQEFNNGHLQSAGQLNFYEQDFGNRLLMLPKDEAIFLYCNTGYRSAIAARFLVQQGYTRVYNMQRGIMEWNYNRLPVARTPGAVANMENSFNKEQLITIINNDSLVFIDFYAPWCAPCLRMMPMIDSLIAEYSGKVHIIKINADASKDLMREMHITGVPYFVLFHRGKVAFHKGGMITREEVEQLFAQYLNL